MASETEIECAILAADGTYNAMGLHAKELGRIIRELEAERDELRNGRDVAFGRVQELRSYISRLIDDNEELEDERDELRKSSHQSALEVRRLTKKLNEVQEAVTTPMSAIPRIITADELKAGQRVSVAGGGKEVTGTVIRSGDNRLDIDAAGSSWIRHFQIDELSEIIILADAPPQEPEPVTAETIRASEPGSTWDASNGMTLEFDGESLYLHYTTGRLSKFANQIEWVLGHHALTRSTAAPRGDYSKPEPARRGRVVKASELRVGDVYDVWYRDTFQGRQRHVSVGPLDAPGWEFRLISRRPPEPSERRFIILHSTRCGFEGPEPAAWNDDDMYLGESFGYAPHEITDWESAKVVPAGQEG